MPFAQKHIGYTSPPRLFLKRDDSNAKNPLGKTAYYNPEDKTVFLYISGRHPKDILRSLGHELVHHKQHCDGMFDGSEYLGSGYAQKDPLMRKAEELANKDGSMCLRDFEDMLKAKNETIYYEHLQEGDYKMSFNDWKEKEISTLLAEAWGFKFNSLQEFEEFDGTGELQAEGEEEIEEGGREYDRGRTPHKSKKYKDEKSAAEDKPLEEGDDEEVVEEGDDAEELEEGDDAEELEEKRRRGRGGDPRNLRGSKVGKKVTEAKIREVLKKAIKIASESKKASRKG